MRAQLQDDQIVITFSFNWDLVGLCKSLPGARYHKAAKLWTVPAIHADAVVPILSKAGFSIDEAIGRIAEAEKAKAEAMERLAEQVDTQFQSNLPLLPYQKVGAAFLHAAGSAILGDDVGLGKTIQSLAVVEARRAGKVLVFVPAILKYQWQAELAKFVPDATSVVIDGTPKVRVAKWQSDVRYYIANYELLLKDFDYMSRISWDYIIADEATRISNPTKSRRVKNEDGTTERRPTMAGKIKDLQAKYRLALTGTPISNRPNEVWNIVDFVSPGAFGKYHEFLSQFCVKDFWGGISGYQNLDQLAIKLKRFMIRRLKEDVLPELPEKTTTDVPFKLSEEEHQLYDRIRKELLFEIDQLDINKLEDPTTIQMTLVKMTRLQQLADSMELLGDQQISSKMEALKQILSGLGDRKVIVFTKFSKMADIIERELGGYKITGDIDNLQRAEIIKAFNGEFNTANWPTRNQQLLTMTSAGQFGLNIQAASVVIHFDQEWSLAKMVQREGRAHRMGQKQKVLVYNLLAKGTIDMYVRKILQAKQALSDTILMSDIKEMLEYAPED